MTGLLFIIGAVRAKSLGPPYSSDSDMSTASPPMGVKLVILSPKRASFLLGQAGVSEPDAVTFCQGSKESLKSSDALSFVVSVFIISH